MITRPHEKAAVFMQTNFGAWNVVPCSNSRLLRALDTLKLRLITTPRYPLEWWVATFRRVG